MLCFRMLFGDLRRRHGAKFRLALALFLGGIIRFVIFETAVRHGFEQLAIGHFHHVAVVDMPAQIFAQPLVQLGQEFDL